MSGDVSPTQARRVVLPANGLGWPVGQQHWRAKVSDDDVAMIRGLREAHGWGYRRIAARFGISHSQVRNICKYQQRAQVVVGQRAVNIRKPAMQGAAK